MTVISSSETFTIADATIEQESVSILVLPVGGAGTGRGRLVHPTLGAYDYVYRPDKYVNLRGDVIVPPVWSHSKTLGGGNNTLWPGYIQDVVCRERWHNGNLSMPASMLDILLSFWTNPPDPEAALAADRYVEWWPSYSTTLGYRVAMLSVTVDDEITLTPVADHLGLIQGEVELIMSIVDYA